MLVSLVSFISLRSAFTVSSNSTMAALRRSRYCCNVVTWPLSRATSC